MSHVFHTYHFTRAGTLGKGFIGERDKLRAHAKEHLLVLVSLNFALQQVVERQSLIAQRQMQATTVLNQLAGTNIHLRRADKPGDKHIFRLVVEIVRGINLHNVAELHHADAVAHGHRFRLIVGDVDGGRRFARFFQLLMQIGNADPHRGAQLGVKVGERFVEQEDVRFFDDRPAHRHALRLAAGELARQAIEQFFQFENFRRFFHLSVDLRLRQLA